MKLCRRAMFLIALFAGMSTNVNACGNLENASFPNLKQCAESGDMASQLRLGINYLKGDGGAVASSENATKWLLASGRQGNGGAYAMLGLATFSGDDVIPKDIEKGIQILNKGADLDDLTSLIFLKTIYEHGVSEVPKNIALVEKYGNKIEKLQRISSEKEKARKINESKKREQREIELAEIKRKELITAEKQKAERNRIFREAAPAMELTLGSINAENTSFFGPAKISFDILNTGEGGTAYVWVVQNGRNYCPNPVLMASGERRSISYVCNEMKEGNFTLRARTYPPIE